jgi:putative GTP pyrophosphokinase
LEKIERKKYVDPFNQVEDICGIRIICYYQSDIQRINEIIQEEFEVLESQDKEELLEADQFGYRSIHFIVKINKNWLRAPNFRGLEHLKAEIQVRTVLMHAWAEIQHKLAYKKESHIPKQFKRKLHRISAKLEEADEQFEEVRKEVGEYKDDVVKVAEDSFNIDIELNLDSLKAFLDRKFPDLFGSDSDTIHLLDELLNHNVSLRELSLSYDKVKPFLERIRKSIYGESDRNWHQVGAMRRILDITNESYRKRTSGGNSTIVEAKKWADVISKKER